MPTNGPEQASCEILTFKEGLLSSVAHDLLLRVTRFELTVETSPASVRAWFDSASIEVVAALRDGRPAPGALRDHDRREIERIARTEVLQARRFPQVTYAATAVPEPGGGYDLRGELTLRGVTRPVSFSLRRSGELLTAEVPIHQPDFGIRPYSAMLGGLKVKADVLVRITSPAEP